MPQESPGGAFAAAWLQRYDCEIAFRQSVSKSANGAVPYQPGATPQVIGTRSTQGLKARFIDCLHMPQSLAQVILHLIFSTKDRHPWLGPDVRPALHAYLATVARTSGCECHRGGVADHVHLALRFSRTLTIAALVEDLKTSSSKWLKTQSPDLGSFAWQRGYGVFSVGPSDLKALMTYIDHQENITGHARFKRNIRRSLRNMALLTTSGTPGIEAGTRGTFARKKAGHRESKPKPAF